MTLAMTKTEREVFLAETRIGVVSISETGRGSLVVPIWYTYVPGGEINFITLKKSRKANLLENVGRISICVHDDELPYRYVSVEGPVTAKEPADLEKDIRTVGRRYLGEKGGDQHAERMKDEEAIIVRMLPERWYSVDYSKIG
jgi:nitroimidazol reductase NimA-like FMN-containing flavoprotein (pyridoxamine 5'-phosphate oxidase superfamily)